MLDFRALKYRKAFTTDAFVVLSTSIAYVYSIISLVTGQDIRFFEASASTRRFIRTTIPF
jgi:Cu+-exporting ATPase